MKRVLVTLFATFALVGGSVAIGETAQADTRNFKDKKSDAPARVDTRKVKVQHKKRIVRVRVKVRNLRGYQDARDYVVVHFDTRAKRRGPEFEAGTGSAHWFFYKTKRNGNPIVKRNDPYGDRFLCRYPAPKYQTKKNRVVFRVPRKCLKNPGRMRVNVLVQHYRRSGGSVWDYSPGPRSYHSWVRR